MAKLVDVYRPDKPLGRRQLPLVVDENLTVIIEIIYTFSISTHFSINLSTINDFNNNQTKYESFATKMCVSFLFDPISDD